MIIATFLMTTLCLADIFSSTANSSLPIPNLARQASLTLIIAENHDSSGSKLTLFQQLNLTTEQQKKIEQIHLIYYPRIITIREKLTAIKEELTAMMASTEPAINIRSKHQEILNLRQELGKLQLETMLETREVLTLEQRKNFADLLKSE